MAITKWAIRPLNAIEGQVWPGLMSIKPAHSASGRSYPFPLADGPLCDRCWIEDGDVWPANDPACPHGGES